MIPEKNTAQFANMNMIIPKLFFFYNYTDIMNKLKPCQFAVIIVTSVLSMIISSHAIS